MTNYLSNFLEKQAALTAERETEEVVHEQPPPRALPDIIILDEAAQFLRISTRTLLRLVYAKRVPAKKVGSRWRFSRASLERYLGVPTTGTSRYVYDDRGRPKD
jgi:excisionase family DNA binding protein